VRRPADPDAAAGTVRVLRVLSYNVRSLRDDRHAVSRTIRRCAPDLVCVQEAPRLLRWRSKVARLARTSGLVVVTGGRPAGAMVLLASLRTAVVNTEDVLLPKRPRLHQRGLAMAVVEVAGARLGIASMHLSLDAAERVEQAGLVLDHLARLDAPHLVLAGDVNESPGMPAWQRLTAVLRDAYDLAPSGGGPTMPARQPSRRLDAVFVSAGIEVVCCGVPDLPELATASDHRPVLVELRVPADRRSGSPHVGC
jgi:endonuclease/exonuclease/phosphatase family metal-dependent hydrolase